MKISGVFRILLIVVVNVLVIIAIAIASNYANAQPYEFSKPPDVIKGGEWLDHFWIGQLQESEYIDVQIGHLFLKLEEPLHWTQTWTAHFASGEFYQTEAIADSVRLAWNEMEQSFFTTGTYTSTVFDAGKSVDWSTSDWMYSGIPDGLIVEFRTGNTPMPGATWTNWRLPRRIFMEDYCAYTFPRDDTECFTNMTGIDSSHYIQYRASFSSNDPTKTIALYDIDFLYGIHHVTGMALSIPVPPVDLKEWESVVITSTIPDNTTLIIDVLAPNGTVLVHDAHNGDSLASIDPIEYPAIQLRGIFATSDESISPDVDLWGVRWSVWNRSYLPAILK